MGETGIAQQRLSTGHTGERREIIGEEVERAAAVRAGRTQLIGEAGRQQAVQTEIVVVALAGRGGRTEAGARADQLRVFVLGVIVGAAEDGIEFAERLRELRGGDRGVERADFDREILGE